MLRMYSSALGLFLSNSSAASKRIAEGDADPGRKTSCEDSGVREGGELRQKRREREKRTWNYLKELAVLDADDAGAVDLADEEDGVGVEVPAERIDASGAGSVGKEGGSWADLRVSPKGPTMTTVLSHAMTTVLFPHQTTWPGAPTSPSLPRSKSDRDRVKSEDATQSCGEEPGRWERRERKRPFGEGVMERKGPRVRCCSG